MRLNILSQFAARHARKSFSLRPESAAAESALVRCRYLGADVQTRLAIRRAESARRNRLAIRRAQQPLAEVIAEAIAEAWYAVRVALVVLFCLAILTLAISTIAVAVIPSLKREAQIDACLDSGASLAACEAWASGN